MRKHIKIWFAVFCAFGIFTLKAFAAPPVENSKKYVVSIKCRYTVSAYSAEDTVYGTGLIVDVEQGLIVTNAHVAGRDCVVNEYEITLHDGRILTARMVCVDALTDMAFLKVSGKIFSEESKGFFSSSKVGNVNLRTGTPAVGEEIYMLGKNENNHFSFQTGTIGHLYEVGPVGRQAYRINLNSQGGSSGSPVFDQSGNVVAIVFASNLVSSAFAIPIDYIKDALNNLKKNNTPTSFTSGAVLAYMPADDMARYYRLPVEEAEAYRARYKDALSSVIVVNEIITGTPAEGVLEPGDIITHIDGQEIGPSIYKHDQALNAAGVKGVGVQFTVWRFGQKMDLMLKPIDANKTNITKMLVFGGAVFYEADISTVLRTGAKEKLFISNIRPGSSFAEKLPNLPRSKSTLVALTHINGQKVETLEDLKKLIPTIMRNKDFNIRFINYGLNIGYSQTLYFAHNPYTQYVTYANSDGPSLWFEFSQTDGLWAIETITENS